MGTFNANIKPASPGLTLGDENQPWGGHFTDTFIDTVASNTPNEAQSNFIRLASGDGIAWRNSANSADVSLSKTTADSSTTPADTLVFSGAGIEGPIISNQLNPAAAGQIRLAATDVLTFRNTANTADIAGLTHNVDDTVTVGGAAGQTQSNLNVTGTITGVNETLSGNLTVAGVITNSTFKTPTTTPNLAVTGADSTFASNAGSVTLNAGSGAQASKNGADITLNSGGASAASGGAGSINLNGGAGVIGSSPVLGTLKTNTTISLYNNVATAGKGVTPIYGATSQKAEAAADANVLTFTPAASVGTYRIQFSMAVSAQNTATLGWTATWTDSNAHAQAPTNLSLFTAGTAAPALTVTGATNGIYYGSIVIDTDNSATAIVVKLTFAGTSFAAKVTATLEQLV